MNSLRPIPIFKVEPAYLRYPQDPEYSQDPDPERPGDWCEIKIDLVGIKYDGQVDGFRERADDWEGALAAMADDLTTLLHEAMDWLLEFDLATPDRDNTYIQFPSISPHKEDSYIPAWTILIELTRIPMTLESQPVTSVPRHTSCDDGNLCLIRCFGVLRCMQLREAGMHDVDIGLEILLDGPQPALWDYHTRCETLRFLRKRGQDIRGERLDRLTEAILKGPPRHLYRDDLTDDEWSNLSDAEVHLRLSNLTESGAALSASVREVYERIQSGAQLQPTGDHSEEFDFSGFGSVGPSTGRVIENFADMPIERFIQWAGTQTGPPWECGGGWHRFVENDIEASVKLLKDAADKGIWPIAPWYRVLDSFRPEEEENAVAQEVVTLLVDMPTIELAKLDIQAARWLESTWQWMEKNWRRKLWRQIWNASLLNEAPEGDLDFEAALNHAGGILG